jgi:hypothetical protein
VKGPGVMPGPFVRLGDHDDGPDQYLAWGPLLIRLREYQQSGVGEGRSGLYTGPAWLYTGLYTVRAIEPFWSVEPLVSN